MKKAVTLIAAALAGGSILLGVAGRGLVAADHNEPPTRTDVNVDPVPDRAADIADIFAWHSSEHVNLALTFAGPHRPELPPVYDRDVLYEINVSNDGDAVTTEIPIRIRFGFDGDRPGVLVTGLPGNASVSGPVETTLTVNGMLVRAGIYDDPFFFDSQGLRETRAAGALRFNNQRDGFGNANDTMVIIQIPRSLVQKDNRLVHVWSATSRFGGNL